jgi:hypothetical protein
MKKKLTLVIDDEVTSRAKRLAQAEGTSVSELVEAYLKERTAGMERPWVPEPGSWIENIIGVMPPFPDGEEDYKVVLKKILMKKHA